LAGFEVTTYGRFSGDHRGWSPDGPRKVAALNAIGESVVIWIALGPGLPLCSLPSGESS